MNWLQSIVLGIVEGLTEFLPISSTFHLILASRLLHLANTDFLALFQVVIQAGAVFALIFIYGQMLLRNRPLLLKVMASFVPTAVIGAILYNLVKTVFFTNSLLQIGVFIAVGIIFLVLEGRVRRGKLVLAKHNSTLDLREAVIIGLAQSLSVIPGVSRSGSILAMMLWLGYRRDQAAEYTFLLSLPTILAASTLDLFQNRDLLLSHSDNLGLLLVGTLASFVTAYVVVHWLLRYLRTHTLEIFGYYRLILAPILLWFLR